MKVFKYIRAIPLLLIVGCSEDDGVERDCIESMLGANNMVAYNGQEVGCNSFLELYHYRNEQFFLLGNHCADMVSFPVDCDGNALCEDLGDAECRDFFSNAERIRIVGIDE